MATFTGKQYGNCALHLARKRCDLLNDTLKLTLHAVGYVPDQDVHDFQDDLSAELATAGGYTAGGITVANKTLTYTGGTNTVMLDGDDISIPTSTLTWRVAVVSDTTPGTAATNPLLVYNLGDADTISTGGTTTITMAATGILTFVAA